MKTNYIILYTDAPQKAGFRGEPGMPKATAAQKTFSQFAAKSKLKFDIETLEGSQADRIMSRNNDVLAVAPAMPLKLIRPFRTNTQPTLPADILWNLQAVGADSSPFEGNGIKICVLDTGIDRKHPAFAGMRITEKDFTGDGPGDQHGHGTHCAGVIFGRDVAGRRIGIARQADDVLIGRVLGSTGGGSDILVNAVQWAVGEGANIISMSLGIDFPGYAEELRQQGMQPEAAVSFALDGYRKNVLLFESLAQLVLTQAHSRVSQPVTIIAAAGNESNRPQYKIAVSPPAVSRDIISVGALGKNSSGLYVAPFSNTGVVLSAPGVDILSAEANSQGLVSMDGTSMATPHVAGIAALWAEKLNKKGPWNPNALYSNLTVSCDDELLSKEDREDYGNGIVQAPLK